MEISGKNTGMDTDQTDILKKIIDEIKDDVNTDAKLLNILEKHIVTLDPKRDAIDQAVSEIDRLAKSPANLGIVFNEQLV